MFFSQRFYFLHWIDKFWWIYLRNDFFVIVTVERFDIGKNFFFAKMQFSFSFMYFFRNFQLFIIFCLFCVGALVKLRVKNICIDVQTKVVNFFTKIPHFRVRFGFIDLGTLRRMFVYFSQFRKWKKKHGSQNISCSF